MTTVASEPVKATQKLNAQLIDFLDRVMQKMQQFVSEWFFHPVFNDSVYFLPLIFRLVL